MVGRTLMTESAPASRNSIDSVVEAFDVAVGKILDRSVAWTTHDECAQVVGVIPSGQSGERVSNPRRPDLPCRGERSGSNLHPIMHCDGDCRVASLRRA